MTEARMTEIYALLDKARVPLSPDQQGPTELLEQLREVRRWQDAVITVSTEVMRETAGAKKAIRSYQAMLTVGTADPRVRESLHDAKDQLDDLRSLEQAIRVCRNNLKTTESDIRLSSHLLDLQIKLGQVTPPAPVVTPSAHASHQPATAIEGLFSPSPATPVERADERGPLHRSAPELSGVVQSAEPLDFSALFAGLTARSQ